MEKRYTRAGYVFFVLTLLFAGMRLLFPEADPAWLKATDDCFDETWWAENARQQILFHRWMGDDYAGAMAVSPVSTGIFFGIFKVFGIHFFSLRLMGMIPAILAILWVLLRKPDRPEENSVNQFAALLLASSPTLFVWSRLGQLESLVGLILLGIGFLGKRPGIGWAVLAGVIAALGIQVKASFILFIIPLSIWCAQLNDTFNKKRSIGFVLGFTVITLAFYLGFYLPNLSKFQAYYEAIQNRSYSAAVLLDPRGWPLRIGWFTTKDFVSDPVTLIAVLLLLTRFAVNRIPKQKFSFTALLLACFMFTMFSDFSERRFIPLLFLIPIALLEETKQKNGNKYGLFVGSFLLLLGLLPVFPKLNWFASPGAIGFNRDFEAMYPFLILLALFCSLFYVVCIKSKRSNLPNALFMCSVLLWCFMVSRSCSHRFEPLTGLPGDVLFYVISGICLVVVISFWKINSTDNLRFTRMYSTYLRLMGVTGTVLCASCLISPSWNLRTAAEYLAIKGKAGETSIGPPSSFSLTFLSKVTPHQYLDLELNSGNKSPDASIRWYCAISTPSCKSDCIENELHNTKKSLTSNSDSTYIIPAYPSFRGYREMAFIHQFEQKAHLCR